MLPSFDPVALGDSTLLAPFWDAFERHEIVLPQCSACHRFQWYPDDTGPDCAGATYEWVVVPASGTIYTMTRVHRAFLPGGADGVPFVVGLIELDGVDGARLVAHLDAEDIDLAIGDRVRARFERVGDGWRPVFGRAVQYIGGLGW